MTRFKSKILPLLLALVMTLTMLPTAAFAAELPENTSEIICTDEACTHEHEETPLADVAEEIPAATGADEVSDSIDALVLEEASPTETATPEESPVSEETLALEEVLVSEDVPVSDETPTSGTIGESMVRWALVDGRLFITGEGDCNTFTSPDDQPWAAHRTEIREVWFDGAETLTIENLAYWFAGCSALETAEVPYTTPIIGTNAFADCSSLWLLTLYHTGSFEIAEGAFATDDLTALEVACVVTDEAVLDTLFTHDWSASNRAAFFVDVYGTTYMATGYCNNCNRTCSYSLDYEQWTSSVHCVRHWCSNCGSDQAGGVLGEAHSFSNGVCTKCGYDNGSGGGSGGGGGSVCYHTSTRTTWSGCDWYEYCRNCGELVDYGTSHGTYVYGSWEYYNSSRHRRYYYCSDCGEGSYTYGYHSTTTQYSPYSSTQHSATSYCATCASYIGSTSYASHSFSYGSWQNYSGTQHRRLKTCSTCGYSEYEYSSHSLSYGAWANYSASQHRRTVSCSTCGYSSYEYASHALTSSAWSSISSTQHRRTLSCSCGYSTTETANHSLTYGAWASISDTQHQRTGTCSCGYSAKETGAHADSDNDGYCDSCNYLMTRFSVTVPASLSLTVSEHGAVYAATNAEIVNNSTGAIEVTGINISAENGWSIVPYFSNMASAKVDAKLIGFSMNGAQSAMTGTSETLSLPGAWSIVKGGALPLTYDAVVSAMSQPVSGQVLTVVFVLNWAVS